MHPPASVGYVGLGEVGHAMASRLTDLPGEFTVFDVDASKAATLVARGARVASSVSHLAELCDVICVRMREEDEVRLVVEELLISTRAGATLLLHTTVRPSTARELSREAATVGAHVLDAAVIGPPSAAEQGRLAILVGGPKEQFERVRPILDRMGDLVMHLGDVGAGIKGKLACKLLQMVSYSAAAEAARLAEAGGISPAVLGLIVRHADSHSGGPGAVLWRETTAPMAHDDPWRDVYTRLRVHGQRELHLAVELASELGVDIPFADAALSALSPALGFPAGESAQPPPVAPTARSRPAEG